MGTRTSAGSHRGMGDLGTPGPAACVRSESSLGRMMPSACVGFAESRELMPDCAAGGNEEPFLQYINWDSGIPVKSKGISHEDLSTSCSTNTHVTVAGAIPHVTGGKTKLCH